jgi:hypothetical protein
MKPETALAIFAAWILAHILLDQRDLDPTLRSILQTVENEELTKLISGSLAA